MPISGLGNDFMLDTPIRSIYLWAGGVRGASRSLAPGSTLAAQLLGAMLFHPFQKQVVDGREVIVTAALQRLT